jgi:4-amino-4-deoxy-L-arabinose transferase-like glycosyltransferase
MDITMKRIYALWLMLPILLTLWGVAVWGANADAIWVDEWWTTYYIGAAPNAELTSPIAVIQRVAENRVHENNPVGYYVLLHLWRDLVGHSDVALRLFSALCSVLTVAIIYRLGRSIGGIKVGLAAAIVLAFSAFFVNYSHELRMYSLACLWGSLGLLAYWQFMHRPKASVWWGAALVISAAGLVYTHYGNTMLVVLLGLYHLFVRPQDSEAKAKHYQWWQKDRRWWMAVGLAVTAGLLFLPHLPITLGIGNRFAEKLSTTDTIVGGIWPLTDVLRMTLFGFANEQWAFLLMWLVAFIVAVLQPMTPRQREGLIFTGALSLGGILTLLALRLSFQTVFHVRYVLVTWLPLSLFTGLVLTLSLQALRPQSRNAIAAVWVIAWVGVGFGLSLDIHYHGNYIHPVFRPAFTEPNRWDEVGQQIQRESRPEDAVAISVGEDLAWAHRGDAEYYFQDIPGRFLLLEDDGVNSDDFGGFVHGAARVWLVRATNHPASPNYQKMEAALKAEGYQICGDPRVQGEISVTLYSVVPQCCAAPQTVLASFGDSVELRYHQATMSENKLSIWQGWQINEGTRDNTYSIGWYLFAPSGDVASQSDKSLPTPGYTCLLTEFEQPIKDGQLRMGIYEWATGARVAVSGDNTADNLLALPISQ